MRTFEDREAKHEISTEEPPPDRPAPPVESPAHLEWIAKDVAAVAAYEAKRRSEGGRSEEEHNAFAIAAMELMIAHRMQLVEHSSLGFYVEDLDFEEVTELERAISKYRGTP